MSGEIHLNSDTSGNKPSDDERGRDPFPRAYNEGFEAGRASVLQEQPERVEVVEISEADQGAYNSGVIAGRQWAMERLRPQLARAYSGLLSVLMDERMDDGMPVLRIVLAQNPDLRDRLLDALEVPRV